MISIIEEKDNTWVKAAPTASHTDFLLEYFNQVQESYGLYPEARRPVSCISRNIMTRNGPDLDPRRGTEQQNRERFAMHAGMERKTTERFIEQNGTDRNRNGHISTPLASQKPMTTYCNLHVSARFTTLLFLKNQKVASAARNPAQPPPGPDRTAFLLDR